MSEYIHEEKKVSNECPKIFALEKSTNIWVNEYIRQYIFEYIRISKYSLHTGGSTFNITSGAFGYTLKYSLGWQIQLIVKKSIVYIVKRHVQITEWKPYCSAVHH